MPDEHDSQHATPAGDAELTAAQRRARAMAEGTAQPADTADDSSKAKDKGSAKTKGKRWGKKKKEKKKYNSILAYLWGEWIRPLGQILIVVMTIRLVAIDWFDVPTGSMEPTIMVGDRILVHKWSYGLRVPFSKESWIIGPWAKPERGEIVVCYSPDQGDEVRLVKRLVAQGGDTIEMRDGRLIINGERSEYTEADDSVSKFIDPVEASKFEFFIEAFEGDRHAVMFERDDPQSIRSFPAITVPEDHYVVIGDNRDNSKDSRQWNTPQSEWGNEIGFIHRNRIHGRAFAVAFSLDKSNFYLPRFSRTGKPLD